MSAIEVAGDRLGGESPAAAAASAAVPLPLPRPTRSLLPLCAVGDSCFVRADG